MKLSSKIVSFPGRAMRRTALEAAFLPQALEIVETPPSPTGRLISSMLIAIFCVALIWACVGQIDIVASATGKVASVGKSKIVQPLETGVVRAIDVQDGQSVKAGETLIELDRTTTEAERDHLNTDWLAARLDMARLTAALTIGADSDRDFHPPQGAGPEQVAAQRQLLAEQLAEHRAKTIGLDQQRAQKEAEKATIAATIAKLETVIPVISERADIRKTLFDHKTGSRLSYLESLEPLVEQQQELNVQKSRLKEATAALAAIVEARAQVDAEYRRSLSADLAEAERKAAGLADDLTKAQERVRRQRLTAPVDGVVQQLAVHTIGGVVTPAQQLMVVVPTEGGVEVEAEVNNRDVGFIRVGQEAQIKVDTFDFTRYGLVRGRVLNVSRDAIPQLRRGDFSEDHQVGSLEASSEPSGETLSYAALIKLDETQMEIDGERLPLTPGMAVTVEFRTGTRSLISYLLSPLFKYRQESMREK